MIGTVIAAEPASDCAIGVIRERETQPDYDLPLLLQATQALLNRQKVPLSNPGASPGCSPILRALLVQSGLAFTVLAELAQDAQPAAHSGGNALDVTAVGGRLPALVELVRAVPQIFAVAASSSIFVWDGAVVAPGAMTAPMVRFASRCTGHLHIASSGRRIRRALKTEGVVDAIGGHDVDSGSGRSSLVYLSSKIAAPALAAGGAKQVVGRW